MHLEQQHLKDVRPGTQPPLGEARLATIIATVHERTGLDFSGYRRPTLQRRVRNRMIAAGVVEVDRYIEMLVADEAEAARLLERLTIKVSRFYRDARTFDYLRDYVLPALRAARTSPLRLWSAGCSHGEEAWTLAMLLDHAGIEGTVLGSDVDELAVVKAREAIYKPEALSELPATMLRRYLEPVDGGFRVGEALRARVFFLQHDVATPAPGKFDLACCRNLLIYLETAAQARVLASIAAGLAPDGFLCLGGAEWLPPAVAAGFCGSPGTAHVFRRDGQ